MKENKTIRVTEGTPQETLQENAVSTKDRLKKPLIIGLMGIVFLGCLYLIFMPSEANKENMGLNDAVPNPAEAGLLDDKQKAYEQEMLEDKDKASRSILTSMADYWTETDETESGSTSFPDRRNDVVTSYRNAQQTLGSFYENDNREVIQLQKQLEELKGQLAEKQDPPEDDFDRQLQLMEKSYEMAAKFLPTNMLPPAAEKNEASVPIERPAVQKKPFAAVSSPKKNIVSQLYREASESEFMDNLSRNHGFYTAGSSEQTPQLRNSVKACIHETVTVTNDTGIRLRLLETAQISSRSLPKGTLLTAHVRFQGGRLQLKVSSIEIEGIIVPVNLTIYDLDGQQGLNVPNSGEMNALAEMAANMSQTSGTSLMMTQSAGQQVAADLSRGVVQGVSGYFSKKVRTPKVTLKAGHQVFLVSHD